MFRPQTNKERDQAQANVHKGQEAQWQAEQSKYLAPTYVPSGNTEDAVKAYQVQESMRRLDEEDERLDEQEAALKKQTLQEEIERAKQSGEELMSAAQYYELAVSQRDGSGDVAVNKPGAAQSFWTALICGEGRAAYDLFRMLYDGDGIAQNQELAAVFWSTAHFFKDPKALPYKGKLGNISKLIKVAVDIFDTSSKAAESYKGGVNFSILQIQTRIFNEILESKNGDLLTIDLADHTILNYLVPFEALPQEEVQLAGHSEHSSGDDCCCAIL